MEEEFKKNYIGADLNFVGAYNFKELEECRKEVLEGVCPEKIFVEKFISTILYVRLVNKTCGLNQIPVNYGIRYAHNISKMNVFNKLILISKCFKYLYRASNLKTRKSIIHSVLNITYIKKCVQMYGIYKFS